jgi:DNA-binding LacI/PurR family transcriptional regulator
MQESAFTDRRTAAPPRVRIADVARRAAVSQATVSRVLNGDGRVHADLRERVLQAVAELDYRPSGPARNLARQRTNTIGMVVADIEHPYFSQMVRAVEDTAYAQGYRVLICNTDENPDKQRSYLLALEDERVLGIIISPTDGADAEISRAIDGGIPVVAFDRRVADERADVVIPDNLTAARAATGLLLDEGHHAIAFVAGTPRVETAAERLAGYEVAMTAADLEPRSVPGQFDADVTRHAVGELLREPNPPSALVIASSPMALGALQAMRDAGLHAPHDLALVSIGEPPWAEIVDPPLTTLAPPVRLIAHEAMELLLERVTGQREQARRIVHQFELRRRGSTGPPPASA